MTTDPAFDDLSVRARRLGMTLAEVVAEKVEELDARWALLRRPNSHVKERRQIEYVRFITGGDVSQEDLERLLPVRREVLGAKRATIQHALERRDGLRCRCCGAALDRGRMVHVDHVLPVAMGGASDLSNYQLLCSECNQGKGDLASWAMANAVFPGRMRLKPTLRMRYAALAYHGRRCTWPDCGAHAGNAELVVRLRVPFERGGSATLDNLAVYCMRHMQEHHRKWFGGDWDRPLSLAKSKDVGASRAPLRHESGRSNAPMRLARD